MIKSCNTQSLILVAHKRTSADAKIGDIKLDNSDSEEETPDEVRLKYRRSSNNYSLYFYLIGSTFDAIIQCIWFVGTTF